MSIDYRLTLAGDIPLEQIAELVAPDATETSTMSGKRMLTGPLSDEYGYVVDIISGSHGYYDAEDDDGSQWIWEPDIYADIDFHMSKDDLTDKGTPNMLTAVARVLTERAEDAALVLNGNWLLLTRVGGVLRKHRPTWWSHHDVDNDIIRQ
ncbi:SitI3 family protein [Plantactinospora sp. KLBMP9567]|uniref:SitI3 family protein n=1 Tax=Plantactinospora sp. KLBMP9567 TaxID=3085900 RepID=UPI0029818FEC|nr:SitI3 family protein [Plantactinospora sp. KLBMP9567]MDW5324789.1 SitI3 family protein [Plantactinospora sp. KLBMP9567]